MGFCVTRDARCAKEAVKGQDILVRLKLICGRQPWTYAEFATTSRRSAS